MPAASRRTLSRTVAPAALLLLAALLAERAGAHGLTFYVLLAGIPVSVIGGLAALDRVVDPDDVAPRLEAALSAFLVFLFVIGAAARSPGTLEDAAPGLASAAALVGLVVVGFLCVATLVSASASAPHRR
jgi:hypothetical protein